MKENISLETERKRFKILHWEPVVMSSIKGLHDYIMNIITNHFDPPSTVREPAD